MDQLEITYETMKQWDMSKNYYTLIDIREDEERKQKNIGGDWIPLSELLNRLNEIPSGNIILYCRSGGRSLLGTKKLRDVLSRDDIYSLHGGILGNPK